eukprot:363269-Chlamydomonas_euryale.AAC.7
MDTGSSQMEASWDSNSAAEAGSLALRQPSQDSNSTAEARSLMLLGSDTARIHCSSECTPSRVVAVKGVTQRVRQGRMRRQR